MGPDGKDTAQAAVYIDGQPVQYAGEITLPEQVERPAPPLLSSMGLTMEQANEAASYLAEAFRIFCDQLAEAARAVADTWSAIMEAEAFRKALRWAEAANRPLAARYHRTKKFLSTPSARRATRWQGYQATAYKMKCLRKAREERK